MKSSDMSSHHFSTSFVFCCAVLVFGVQQALCERGAVCDNVVCAGNATCLIDLARGETLCVKREKRGGCGAEDEHLACQHLELLCVSDSDCEQDQICCFQGCQRRCKTPQFEVVPKPGHCPSRYTFGPCVTECGMDAECPDSTKCCNTGCGFVCLAPAVTRPGICPLPVEVGGACETACTQDSQCEAGLKCCSNGCGSRCAAASGRSPCAAGVTFHNRCNLCTCTGRHEPVPCGNQQCPLEKPGYCPGLQLQAQIAVAGCGVECSVDSDCPDTTRCCQVDGCGKTCAPVAESKWGVCPVAEGSDPCGEYCYDDSDCQGGAKCCLTGCGKLCKAPEAAGFCPPQLSSGNCFFRNDHCASSHECSSGQVCCDSPCGRACSWPVAEKPGLCPAPVDLVLTIRGKFCTSDEQCGRQLKCCSDSSGNTQCTPPVAYKRTCRNVRCNEPGHYCIDTVHGPECVNKPKTTCDNTVCDSNTGCLQKQDYAICVAHTKVGQCPLNGRSLYGCESVVVECQDDSQCEGELICCTSGCTRKCVQPLKTDCATIGRSLCQTAGYVCRDTDNGAICVQDEFTCEHKKCPGGYKCHEGFSGASCVKERQTCGEKLCAPGEVCYEEGDEAICHENSLQLAAQYSSVAVRPGRCPAVVAGSYRGDCRTSCHHDRHCAGSQLCCDTGCASHCVAAVLKITCHHLKCPAGYACVDYAADPFKDAICVNTTKNPGRCPDGLLDIAATSNQSAVARDNTSSHTGDVINDVISDECRQQCGDTPCRHECRFDSQCGSQQKCCSDGCTRLCSPPDLRRRCTDTRCEEDYFCHDDQQQDAVCLTKKPNEGRCHGEVESVDVIGEAKQCIRPENSTCQYDAQCLPGHKCCLDECGKQSCVSAVTRLLCEDITCDNNSACVANSYADAQCFPTEEKDGLCPHVLNGTRPRGGCTSTCEYDSQCDGDAKCCWNGCAKVCLPPRPPDCTTIRCAIGQRCLEDRSGAPYCAPIPCKQDGEIIDIECNSCTCIQGFLLCSQEECPPAKAGFCPRLTKGYKGQCVEECGDDYECDGDFKCCFTGCGHTCQSPVPEVVHPCRTVRFRCGDATRCAATRGLCQPGKTCPLSPLCVSKKAPFCAKCPPGKVCVLQKHACETSGACDRQPICIQLYSDDTVFEEDDDLETEVVIRQNS